MEQMDSTVIATALPAIAADIGAEPISLKLALTSYFVALAIFIPLSGWMADRFGARNIFRAAIGVFIMGSICCAFSNSLLTFVLSRFLQGSAGAMMVPVARMVLVRVTPRHELVSAMAWLTIPGLLGPLTGPPLGGFLTTYFSWHWIFWINVPIGVAGIVLVSHFLKNVDGRNPRPIDLVGLGLSGIAFAGIIFGLSVISLPAIPLVAGYVSVGVGALALWAYLRHAGRTEHPILDPKVFRLPLFRSSIIGGSLFRIGVGAFPFLLPLMLQLSFGLTPLESGMITFVTAIGAIASKIASERLLVLVGFKRTLVVTAVVGCLMLAVNGLFTPETPHWLIMAALVGGGLARSMFFTSTNALMFADGEDAAASQVSMLNSVAQQLAVATGVALAGGILEVSSSFHGGGLRLEDFHLAWFVIAAIAVASALPFLRIPPDAGSALSGHRLPPPPARDE